MITDETVDKAALAGLNAVRTANGFQSLASIEELPPDDTYRWRQEYRAALEAVEADIRNAAFEEAKQAVMKANADSDGDATAGEFCRDIEALKTREPS